MVAARYDHNRVHMHSQLPKGQMFGWQCPCCNVGLPQDKRDSAHGSARTEHAFKVPGFGNFHGPVWLECRSTVVGRRAWRCVKCFQCCYHRKQVRKHRCTGDSSHVDLDVRKQRLQALDLGRLRLKLAMSQGFSAHREPLPKCFAC